MEFQKKNGVLFKHYKDLIESRRFDEYDILGFLIFIRSYLDRNQYKYIHDFSDLIAHRDRNQGIASEAIKGAIDNEYAINQNGFVVGYSGIIYEDWMNEWYTFGNEFDVSINEIIVKEISLCIISLSQFTVYRKGDYVGEMNILRDNKCNLYLVTNEKNPNSLCINFFKLPLHISEVLTSEYIFYEPVETKRIEGDLCLSMKEEMMIKIGSEKDSGAY